MLDINFIKNNPGALDLALKNRNEEPREEELLSLYKKFIGANIILEMSRKERNFLSKMYAKADDMVEIDKTEYEKDCPGGIFLEIAFRDTKCNKLSISKADFAKSVNYFQSECVTVEEAAQTAYEEFSSLMEVLPNIPSSDCPVGKDESSNLEISKHGEPRKFDFEPKEHFEIGQKLGMMNFEKATKIAGSRFVFLFSKLAKLERALAQFMLHIHTIEHGYTEVYVPLILNKHAMFGVGQLPKFEKDLFKTIKKDLFETTKKDLFETTKKDLFETTNGSYLIPTAEASLTNLYYDDIIEERQLPLRLTAYTPCFRSEAGAAGRDTKGMLRQHQFGKVELVSITTPEQSRDEHERMTACAEEILKRLELPFRTVVLSTGDMGFAAEKTYDIEVWLPGQGTYREISSCSSCNSFQARRMKTRFKNNKTKKNEYVHTLNGSGVAVGRCLIAVLENYQQEDGSVTIPDALIPFFEESVIKSFD